MRHIIVGLLFSIIIHYRMWSTTLDCYKKLKYWIKKLTIKIIFYYFDLHVKTHVLYIFVFNSRHMPEFNVNVKPEIKGILQQIFI